MPPLTGSNLTYWRQHPQSVQGYLAIWVPERVVRRRINQSSFAYPARTLTIDNPDGDTGDTAYTEKGMRVRISSSAGVFKGETVLSNTMPSTAMTISPTGPNDIIFADNDIVDVYADYPLWSILPYISPTGALYKNYSRIYVDEGEKLPPVANAAVDKHAGFVDGTGYLTVSFDGTSSYTVADGATIIDYSWLQTGGTVVSGGVDQDQVTLKFPAGQYWVTLAVKDSNNITSVKRIPIWAANTTTYAPRIARLSRRGYASHQGGWEASFELLDSDTSDIPDGALCLFWQDERYGSYHGSVLASTTGFFGWITAENLHMEPLWSDNVINAVGPIGALQQRPAFPQTVKRSDTPATWAEVKGLDWWKTIIYLLCWHSNLLELCNLERPGYYDDYPVVQLDAEAGTLYDQIVFLAHAVFGEFTADRSGQLYLRRNPHLMTASERSAHTTIVHLTAADLASDPGPSFERQHWPSVGWLRASAIQAGTTIAAVQCIAPGTMPAQGPTMKDVSRLLVVDQDDLNIRIGHQYAYEQAKRDGIPVMRRGEFAVLHRGDVFDPALQEVVTLTLAATTNRRGYAFTAARLVITALDILEDHEHAVSLDRLSVEEETRGTSATTVLPSTSTASNQPNTPYQPIAIILPDPGTTDPTGFSAGVVHMAAFSADGYLYLTEDFDTPAASGGPTWTRVSLGVDGTPLEFAVDAFSPRYLGTGTPVNGWLVTTSGIYFIEDIGGTHTATLQKTFDINTTEDQRALDFNFAAFGKGIVVTHYQGDGTYATYTTDGETWSTEAAITTNVESNGNFGHRPGLYSSTHAPGTIYAGAFSTGGSGAAAVGDVYKSTNYGASWALDSGYQCEDGLAEGLHYPFADNGSDGIAYYNKKTITGSFQQAHALMRRNADTTHTDVAPTVGGRKYGRPEQRWGIATCPINRQRLILCGRDDTDDGARHRAVFASTDAGDAWTTIVGDTTGNQYTRAAVAGDDADVVFLWGMAGMIAYSDDFGAAVDSRSGNLGTLSAGALIGVCGL